MGGPESVQTIFSNLHCIILIENDSLRYIILGYYCILHVRILSSGSPTQICWWDTGLLFNFPSFPPRERGAGSEEGGKEIKG